MHGPSKPSYLEIESKMTGLGLLQVTLGVFQTHLQAMGLGLDLAQLCLLPLGFHLLLEMRKGDVGGVGCKKKNGMRKQFCCYAAANVKQLNSRNKFIRRKGGAPMLSQKAENSSPTGS